MDESVVLVVEDDSNLRELLRTLLDDLFGVKAIGAADGEEALRLIARQRPALILLDIMLPGISGFEVAKRLRADPATREIPIIAVTAGTATERAVAAGCDEAIAKPFDVDYFLSRVQKHLSQRVELVAL